MDLGIKHSEGSGERSGVSAHVHFCERVDFEGHHTVGRAKNQIFEISRFFRKVSFRLITLVFQIKVKNSRDTDGELLGSLEGLGVLEPGDGGVVCEVGNDTE